MYKTIITYGTFDCLHWGHIYLLSRAAERCEKLIVAVSTDGFNKLKGKDCLFSYRERAKLIKNLPFVEKVIPEKNWEQKEKDIEKYNVDCLVMGDDWRGKFDHLPCRKLYLPRTKGISTAEIKRRCKNLSS